jgi:hypothetical protein
VKTRTRRTQPLPFRVRQRADDAAKPAMRPGAQRDAAPQKRLNQHQGADERVIVSDIDKPSLRLKFVQSNRQFKVVTVLLIDEAVLDSAEATSSSSAGSR